MGKYLVTGGAGFIGAHVVNQLVDKGVEVIALDDLSGGFRENINPSATFIEGSVVNHELLENLFDKYKFDYVFHLAAYAAEGLSHFIKRFNYTNNIIGSVNLINESVKHKIKCFVFTSSIAVYGSAPPPMHEDMAPVPEDPYGIAKLAVEQDLKTSHDMFGLNYIIFRPHNVYGEYQNLGDRYRNVVGIFMNQLMEGKPLTVFGDGRQTRAFSYIGDVAPIIAKSINVRRAYGQIINIGADKEYTINELAGATMDAMKIKGVIKYVAERNEVKHAYANHSKAKKLFDFESSYSLEKGVRRMAKWAKTTGIRKSMKFKNIEILDRLPAVWIED